MAQIPLPDDPADLRLLLSQAWKFLDHAEEHYSKIRMQELMIRRALNDPEYLVVNANFAARIKEEIARTWAALVFPSKLLHAYLDDAGAGVTADIAEEQEPARTIDLSPEITAKYERLNSAVRAFGEVMDSYSRLAGEILVKLAAIPAADPNSSPKLSVDRANGLVVFGGLGITVGEVGAAIFQALIDAPGGWIASREMRANDPILESVRVDRIVDKLPPKLRELDESEPGKGYQLKKELLA